MFYFEKFRVIFKSFSESFGRRSEYFSEILDEFLLNLSLCYHIAKSFSVSVARILDMKFIKWLGSKVMDIIWLVWYCF